MNRYNECGIAAYRHALACALKINDTVEPPELKINMPKDNSEKEKKERKIKNTVLHYELYGKLPKMGGKSWHGEKSGNVRRVGTSKEKPFMIFAQHVVENFLKKAKQIF